MRAASAHRPVRLFTRPHSVVAGSSAGLSSLGRISVGLSSVGLSSAGLSSVGLSSVGLSSVGLISVELLVGRRRPAMPAHPQAKSSQVYSIQISEL